MTARSKSGPPPAGNAFEPSPATTYSFVPSLLTQSAAGWSARVTTSPSRSGTSTPVDSSQSSKTVTSAIYSTSSSTSGGSLGWSFVRSYRSHSGLNLSQHFARSEDRSARFLRGAGHRHVRLNAHFLGKRTSRTVRAPRQHIVWIHERTRTHTIIPHLDPPAYGSPLAFFASSDGWL